MALSRHLPRLLLVLALVCVIAGIALVAYTLSEDSTDSDSLAQMEATATPAATAPAATPTRALAATATQEPTAAPEPTIAPEVPIARLSIPSIGVDANVVTKGVSADGVMQDPEGPRDVAWYDFSALPGRPGNIVMAGHVDYANYGAAVFYYLDDLSQGDEVLLHLATGETALYRVASVSSYDAATAPVEEIVGPTLVETVTLITCGGTFDPRVREYDERVIVRATRVL